MRGCGVPGMAAPPGAAGESFGSLLRGGAAEHAALVSLLAGSELSSRAECAPLPPASFADAQRLADGRDGRQRKEGKTKVPVKKVVAGPPDSSAFWLLSEVPLCLYFALIANSNMRNQLAF